MSQAQKEVIDPLESFRSLIEDRQQKAVETMPVYYNEQKKGWAKRKITVSDVEYDVVKTDSLVSPFIGKLALVVTLQQSEFFPSKELAVANTFFEPPGEFSSSPCRAEYAFQNNKWILKSREYCDYFGDWNKAPEHEPESWPTAFLLML